MVLRKKRYRFTLPLVLSVVFCTLMVGSGASQIRSIGGKEHEDNILGVKIGMTVPEALQAVFINADRKPGQEKPDARRQEGRDKKDVRVLYNDLKVGKLQIAFLNGTWVREIVLDYSTRPLFDELRLAPSGSINDAMGGGVAQTQKGKTRRANQERLGAADAGINKTLGEAAALLQSGRLEEAELAIRKIVAENPGNADAHTLLGVALDQRGFTADAEREYHAALHLKPNSITALANLGVVLARTNRSAQAIEKFEAVLRMDPQHASAVFNLGALYAARGDYKRAIPLLEKTAGISPGKPQALKTTDPSLLLTLLNAYVHADRRGEALQLSRSVEEAAGNEPKTLFTLALSLAEAHQYEEAVRLFKRTNELRPQTYEVLYNLGVALYNLDRLDEAKEALSLAAAIAPNEPEPYYRLGLIASAQGDTKAALMYWTKSLELRPVFAEANFMIAEELLKKQLAEKAIPFYERALEQDQAKLVYYLRLGVANVRGQRYEQAREVFTRALQRFPDNANLYFLLGYTGRAEGQYDRAVTAFREALRLQPDNPDALGNLGYIASQRGEHEEAERLLRRAIALAPDGFPAYHDLGRLLVKLKKYDEAVGILRRGSELYKKDPGVHYQLFLAYSRLRRKPEAEQELAAFKQLDETSRRAVTPSGMTVKAGPASETEALPPLPSAAAGETKKPAAPRD
jgi:tetratricopeptide (TPR) repeat protein